MPTLAEPGDSLLTLDQLTLKTAFQPVFSLTHGRLVGHEALLRACDANDRPVPPQELFAVVTDPAALVALDARAVRQHLTAYVEAGKKEALEWLLLNLHPLSLLPDTGALDAIIEAIKHSGLRPSRIVIEVLESPLFQEDRVYPALQRLRDLGCLIALDDFGAGHSNFERVFDLRPHLVKLDRRVLLRAKSDIKARRILQRMVSLIQECGSLVLIEGVETLAGAHVALTCDVDFVQGYYFGRPGSQVLRTDGDFAPLLEAWDSFDEGQSLADDRWRESMGQHCDELRLASIQLAAGTPIDAACAGFLASDRATMCYLLDERGQQIEHVAFRDEAMRARLTGTEQFEPLRDCAGARWSRRQYFRRAVSFPGSVQITRPYLTLQGGWMCLTASIAFEIGDRQVILCGDLRVHPTESS